MSLALAPRITSPGLYKFVMIFLGAWLIHERHFGLNTSLLPYASCRFPDGPNRDIKLKSSMRVEWANAFFKIV